MYTEVIVKRIVWLACCALAAMVGAMPTKDELAQAQPLVNDLTADDLRALKAKEKTPGDVAAAHLALADKAETEAGKYLLMHGAFRLYARSEDYDSAAEVLQRMRGEISDLPPEVIVEIVNDGMRRVAADKAPKVLAIFRDAQRTIKCRKRLAAIAQAAKSKPGDPALQRQLAECHVGLGDWAKALETFAKLGDEAAKWELGKSKGCDAAKAADFWWNYKTADAEPFKAHAVQLYRSAVDANQVLGLKREVAEKRLAEFEASGVPVMAAAGTQKGSASASAKRGRSIKVKIKKGIELEFIPCPAGTFTMGIGSDPDKFNYKHEVTITRPFWMSKYPITVEQFGAFCRIDGEFIGRNGKQGEPKAPVCLRFTAAEDYCRWLNRRFAPSLPRKCIFRLPTDAEWEYALFANSTDKDDPYVRFRDGEKSALQEICGTNLIVSVGTAGKPNAWGLYDMLGNGCHYVLDTINGKYCSHGCRYGGIGWKHRNAHKCGYKESETDPLRWYVPTDEKTGAWHLMRGGKYSMEYSMDGREGPHVYHRMASFGEINLQNRPDRPRIWTFRVVIGPDLLKERDIKLPKLGK